MARYRGLAGIVAEEDPVAGEALVHGRSRGIRIQRLAEPDHLVGDQRVHRVEDQRPDGRRTVACLPRSLMLARVKTTSRAPPGIAEVLLLGRIPPNRLACQARQDGKHEALGLARAGSRGDDGRLPGPDASLEHAAGYRWQNNFDLRFGIMRQQGASQRLAGRLMRRPSGHRD